MDDLDTTGTSAEGATAFGAFDALSASDPAPDWLRDSVVSEWGFPGDAEVALVTVSENATFIVTSGSRSVAVVRLARPGYLAGAGAVESEVAWVKAIAADGVVKVAEPLAARDGSYVKAIADPSPNRRGGEAAPWLCVCFAFVAGSILQDVADPTPYYRRLGAMTAQLHDHARHWQRPSTFERHSWELTDMVGVASRWGRWEDVGLDDAEARLLATAQERALGIAEAAETSPATWGLIHADLRPSNLIIDGDELTVIDFDDCGSSWFLYDFAAAFSFIEHGSSAPSMAQDWVAGYRDVASFTAQDATVGNALSMIRRLQMLGWTTTHRSDALPADLWDAQRWGTVEVARRYLESPTWLLD